jgi:hypothetical protein
MGCSAGAALGGGLCSEADGALAEQPTTMIK